FRTSHVLGRVGEGVERRFLIDEYLLVKNPGFAIADQPDRDGIKPTLLEPIEQMGTALAAEAAFGPVRRGINADVFLAAKLYFFITFDGQQRATAPDPTHGAVACAHVVAGGRDAQANRTAQASALAFLGC